MLSAWLAANQGAASGCFLWLGCDWVQWANHTLRIYLILRGALGLTIEQLFLSLLNIMPGGHITPQTAHSTC